jgi:hypothetical protein
MKREVFGTIAAASLAMAAAIPNGRYCRNRYGAERCPGIGLTGCRGLGSRAPWLRNRRQR